MKLSPDELAEQIKKMVTDNGDLLTLLKFDTIRGSHSYAPLGYWRTDGTPVAVLVSGI
jgi:hypothetical protein